MFEKKMICKKCVEECKCTCKKCFHNTTKCVCNMNQFKDILLQVIKTKIKSTKCIHCNNRICCCKTKPSKRK